MVRMAQAFDICIRGAGIVGRSLALQLASKRLQVALVESQYPVTPENKVLQPGADPGVPRVLPLRRQHARGRPHWQRQDRHRRVLHVQGVPGLPGQESGVRI